MAKWYNTPGPTSHTLIFLKAGGKRAPGHFHLLQNNSQDSAILRSSEINNAKLLKSTERNKRAKWNGKSQEGGKALNSPAVIPFPYFYKTGGAF